MTSRPKGLAEFSRQLLRGICMGGADVIPGVSGGTVALILGIYQRLVTSISHFDMSLLLLLRRKKWREAVEYIDLGFLVALGIGIGLGIFTAGRLVIDLLSQGESTREPTWAAFFGMILASTWLVSRYVEVDSRRQKVIAFALALAGAGAAYGLTTLQLGSAEPTPAYIFLCGMLGICAMILPGISGAYILLILGVYVDLTHLIKKLPEDLLHGNLEPADIATVLLFASGCAVGLLAFSKVLRWLLTHYQPYTMAVMSGFMLGALRKVWPFQQDLTPEQAEFKLKQFKPIWPEKFDGHAMLCLTVVLVGMVVVLAADRLTSASRPPSE